MSEELRHELSQIARVHRMKVQGFGSTETPFTGNAAGVSRRQVVKYTGVGAFLITGITFGGLSVLSTWQLSNNNRALQWTVFDQNLKTLWGPSWIYPFNFNSAYENLDHGVLLKPQDYLVIEMTNYAGGASRQPVGILWGDEFLFDDPL
jgi:hypothetical protein